MSDENQRRLAAIVCADIVGYSRLMGADESGTLRRLNAFRSELIDPLISQHNGRIVKTMGDGLLLEFPSVVAAVECCINVQNGMAGFNAADNGPGGGTGSGAGTISLRIGVHLGDVIIEGSDIFGDGVNIASRLEGLSEPGGIALSDDAYRQVRDRIDIDWLDGGEQEVKNIARPVQVWRWSSQAVCPADISAETSDPPALPDKPSIVVLPFNNMSGDPEQEYFSDGITEDITTELSRFGELFVIARNTAFTYKGQSHNVRDIARELGVQFVLEGSVRRAGNRVRINAQLIDGLDGNHLWADRYDGSIEEVFDLQDQVTQKVVSATMPNIEEAALARIKRGAQIFDSAHDLAWKAYDEMLEASRLAQPAMMQAAKTKANKAIELNQRCYRAYHTICMANWVELLLQWPERPDDTKTELKRTAAKFVNLSPSSHVAHYCNGIAKMMTGQFEAGVRDLRLSIELNPIDSSVLSLLAHGEVQLNNLSEAKAVAARAIRINPKDWFTGTAYLALAQAAFVEGDEQCRHWAEKAIQAEPKAPMRRIVMIAHAAEIGDRRLLDEHLTQLDSFAPKIVSRFLNNEIVMFIVPEHREKVVQALIKAGLAE